MEESSSSGAATDLSEEETKSHDTQRRRSSSETETETERGRLESERSATTPGFISARMLLTHATSPNSFFLSPNFRSVAASAGWDDEALLLASFDTEEGSSLADHLRIHRSPLIVEDSPVRASFQRKRTQRTPALAKTPASAARRSRRARRQTIHAEELPRVGALTLEDDSSSLHTESAEQCKTPGLPKQNEAGSSIGTGKDNKSFMAELQSVASSQTQEEDKGDGKAVASKGKHKAVLRKKAQSKGDSAKKSTPDQKEKHLRKSDCLDKLREELSCAICLEICFEPSSTSCGHSFCKECLQNSIERCGARCPKCRQRLRGQFGSCQINTVLWNTIQLLFPEDVSEKSKSKNEVEKTKEKSKGKSTSTSIQRSTRALHNGSYRQNQPLRTVGLSRRGGGSRVSQLTQTVATLDSTDEEVDQRRNRASNRSYSSMQRLRRPLNGDEIGSRGNTTTTEQEELDAQLASRLQQEEFMSSLAYSRRNRAYPVTRRPSEQPLTVSSAAANLRAMASRALRLRPRSQ